MNYLLITLGSLLLLIIILIYNTLVNQKNKVDNAFGSIDVMLKKRRDLIPNLVAIVKQYTNYERGLLEEITRLRGLAMQGGVGNNAFETEKKLEAALHKVMIAVEDYPDLKANRNFLHLQDSLNEVEDQISAARRAFNAAVMDYNNAIEVFPSNLLAKVLNYQAKKSFEITQAERENIDINELFKS